MSSLALLFFPQNLKNDIVNFGGEDYTTDDDDVAALKMKLFLFCSQRMGFNGSLPVLFHLVALEPALGWGNGLRDHSLTKARVSSIVMSCRGSGRGLFRDNTGGIGADLAHVDVQV